MSVVATSCISDNVSRAEKISDSKIKEIKDISSDEIVKLVTDLGEKISED